MALKFEILSENVLTLIFKLNERMKSPKKGQEQNSRLVVTPLDDDLDENAIKSEIEKKSGIISQIKSNNEILNQNNFLLTQKFQQTCSYNQQLGDELANFQEEIIVIQSSNQAKKACIQKLSKESNELKELIDSTRQSLLSDGKFKVTAERLKKIEGKKATLIKNFKSLRGDEFDMNDTSLSDNYHQLKHSIHLLKERHRDLQEHLFVLQQLNDENLSQKDRSATIDELSHQKEEEYFALLDELQALQNPHFKTPKKKPKSILNSREVRSVLSNPKMSQTKESKEADEIIAQRERPASSLSTTHH